MKLFNLLDSVEKRYSKELLYLIKGMLQIKEKDRFNIEDTYIYLK